MNNSFSESYKKAGVDVTAGYKSVELMKEHIARTMIKGTLSGIGGFGGLFELDMTGISKPVLVSGTDGVGTKIKLAFIMDKHDTVGIDCVAMCVNDIICCGAKPLFFLDYIAIGRNDPRKVADLVSGVAEGCVQAGCALVGGETAEHPGTMAPDDYDLAGFSVGIVDRGKILDPAEVRTGDVLLGLPSSGIHSNGYSLVRKVFDTEHCDLGAVVPELGLPLGEALLIPTRIYVKPVLAALETGGIHGISHITGGGFYENIPRCLPAGLGVKVEKASVPVQPVFRLIQEKGKIPERDMFNTFNMGVGMSLVVAAERVDAILEILPDAVILGEVGRSDEPVVIC